MSIGDVLLPIGEAPEIKAWLEAFGSAVRGRDYDAGLKLFDPEVIGFGTVQTRVDDLEQLVRKQWGVMWPATVHFCFDLDAARCHSDGELTLVVATWSSEGIREDGSSFPRFGRATIGLKRLNGDWLAIHTHFSINPA